MIKNDIVPKTLHHLNSGVKEKIEVSNLGIEITRRCNMQPPCRHCFRGDAEPIDLNLWAVNNLLEQVTAIDYLCITGGEPMLNIPAMRAIFSAIQANNIRLGCISLVTNGLLLPQDFISLVIDMEKYISPKGHDPCIEIGVSWDRYHANDGGAKFIKACNDAFKGKRISVMKQMTGANPLRIGRAKELSFSETTKCEQLYNADEPIIFKNRRIETQLYLSAKGLLYSGSIATNTYQYIDHTWEICDLTEAVDIMQAVCSYNNGCTPSNGNLYPEKTLAEKFTENVNLYIRMLIVVQNPCYAFSNDDRNLAGKDLTEITDIYNAYERIDMSEAVMIWLEQKPFCKTTHNSNFSHIRAKILDELTRM